VPGAQSGTLKHYPETKRQTNPLFPLYDVPGHTENAGAFGGPASTMSKTYVEKREREDPKKPQNLGTVVAADKNEFKKDMGKFFDVPQAEA